MQSLMISSAIFAHPFGTDLMVSASCHCWLLVRKLCLLTCLRGLFCIDAQSNDSVFSSTVSSLIMVDTGECH